MSHISYSEGTIKFMESREGYTEYIFAIDGSGSMEGQPWNDQLTSLKSILSSISTDPTNKTSILVFNTSCIPFCIHKDPSKIDVSQIPFPGGGTTPDPAFIKAAYIISEVCIK
jgi:hypothetical protein